MEVPTPLAHVAQEEFHMDTTEVRLLTRKDVTRLMKISLGTLEQHVKDGVLPKFRPVRNGRLLYLREDDYFAAINESLPRTPPSVTAKPSDLAPGRLQAAPTPTARVSERPSTYRGSAVDRARQREAKLLAKMNSK
jgi:hypothetical protein